jgi:toxin ParE1/3/4
MADLRLSAMARRDLEAIRDAGVEEFGPDVAERHLLGFEHHFGLLRQHPFAGQSRPEFALGIRSLSHRPHRLLYRVDGDTVLVVRIIHHRQDVRGALRGS